MFIIVATKSLMYDFVWDLHCSSCPINLGSYYLQYCLCLFHYFFYQFHCTKPVLVVFFFFGFSYLLIILVLNLSWNADRGWINFIYFNIWALWALFFYIKKHWFGLLAHNCFINDMWLYSSYYNINCMHKHEINTSVEVLCRNGAGEILKWDVLLSCI